MPGKPTKRSSSKPKGSRTRAKASSVKNSSPVDSKASEPKKTRKPAPKGKDGKFRTSHATINRGEAGVIHRKKAPNHVRGGLKSYLGKLADNPSAETVEHFAKFAEQGEKQKEYTVRMIQKVNQRLKKMEAMNEFIEASPVAARYLVCLVRGKYDDGSAITDAPHAVRLQAARTILEYGGLGVQEQQDARDLQEMSYQDLLTEHQAVNQELAQREASDAEIVDAGPAEAPQQQAESTA